MSRTTNYLLKRLISPGGLFLGGFLLLIAGVGLNYFLGAKGEVRLDQGKANIISAVRDTSRSSDFGDEQGFTITLDSLTIQPYTPEYEIQLWRKDTTSANPHSLTSGTARTRIDQFSMEPMQIRKVEKTDLRFRLKAFYPNFEFAYEYPVNRDTIEPKAPGITLELKTREGSSIVTLRTDQPNKHKLDDIVSLGASLSFFWDMSPDSIKTMVTVPGNKANKIVFSGADGKVYFILGDKVEEQPLKEKIFYTMPGTDSVGFTILYCFPDIAFLQAVPSSRGTELLNPVAHVEIWRLGGPATDAFIYPETRVRKGGDFEIPDSDYKLGMGLDLDHARKYCDCIVSLQRGEGLESKSLEFKSGNTRSYKDFRFTPYECSAGLRKMVVMKMVQVPGNNLVIAGFGFGILAILLWFLKRKPLLAST